MARSRTISPDFWTWEAVIDCAPMTRLLFIGLWNFADDGGVQPLRPRTIRMQVFPGDTIENDRVRAMLDELAAQGLVRIYSVDGQDYVAIVDWEQLQRVGKRARPRYPSADKATRVSEPDQADAAPALPSGHRKPSQAPLPALGVSEVDEGPPGCDHREPLQSPSPGGSVVPQDLDSATLIPI